MPYFIAVYDIGEKRVGKMLKLFRQYLNWVQNSVFEGDLTHAQYQGLQFKIETLMEPHEDSVIFYKIRGERYAERTVIGLEKGNRTQFI